MLREMGEEMEIMAREIYEAERAFRCIRRAWGGSGRIGQAGYVGDRAELRRERFVARRVPRLTMAEMHSVCAMLDLESVGADRANLWRERFVARRVPRLMMNGLHSGGVMSDRENVGTDRADLWRMRFAAHRVPRSAVARLSSVNGMLDRESVGEVPVTLG